MAHRWNKQNKSSEQSGRWSQSESAEATRNRSERALDTFAEMMIDKIKSFNGNWHKPWFSEKALSWPKNLNGRMYNGMNALMLMMLCENENYKIPVFMTHDSIYNLNRKKDKHGVSQPIKNDKGENMPFVHVNKGAKSFPVFITTFTIINLNTKEKIPYDDYKQMSDEERSQYAVYPKYQVYNVFNVDQTNLKEARPELYKMLERENIPQRPEAAVGEIFSFPAVDRMISNDEWICPITPTNGDKACYNIKENKIVVPEKKQFKDGESFYTTTFHEMAHSTGHHDYLDRLRPTPFGSPDYAREELVAELTAALTGQRYGIVKNLKEDSVAYLKSWLSSLEKDPSYIKTVLTDVKKAEQIISNRIEAIQMKINMGDESRLELNQNPAVEHVPEKQQMYFASVAYLQSAGDTILLDQLKENDDYDRLLQEAKGYDQGEAIDLENTHASVDSNPYDSLLVEDEHYAVVYNASVGGTYEIKRKVSEQEVRDMITRYGLPTYPSQDIVKLHQQMLQEEQVQESKSESEGETISESDSKKLGGVDIDGDGQVESDECHEERTETPHRSYRR